MNLISIVKVWFVALAFGITAWCGGGGTSSQSQNFNPNLTQNTAMPIMTAHLHMHILGTEKGW